MIKRILVTLSANRYSDAAVATAIELAQRHDAELVGVTDVDERAVEQVGMTPIGGGSSAQELAEYRRNTVEARVDAAILAFGSTCREASVTYSVHREHGEPFEQLTRLWRYCDLTISGLQGLFEYEVIQAPKDVVIRLIGKGVRPIIAVSESARPIRRALIAYNGSMESAKAMKRFVQMRLWPDAPLKIMTFGATCDEREILMNDAAGYCGAHGYHVEIEGSDVSARDGLLEMCERSECDLIVMGSTARSRIVKRLLGDTVYHAIRHSPVPLFLAN